MTDVVLVAERAVARQLLVEAAERRALVAGDEGAGVQAAAAIGAVLVEQQAHERLDAGEQDAALVELVAILERDLPRLAPGPVGPPETLPRLGACAALA